ncbi:hypothetical protein CRM22_009148 [Opisthorchis felineus]|uniref:Uncharacterized protein n=1 Tax=Opisthorchis felineus TaxID=147828 RepID=A0A4S2L8M5_OPIFE|nr:hypothetical protein CRM22_009148 [Opisthorchis felineus]
MLFLFRMVVTDRMWARVMWIVGPSRCCSTSFTTEYEYKNGIPSLSVIAVATRPLRKLRQSQLKSRGSLRTAIRDDTTNFPNHLNGVIREQFGSQKCRIIQGQFRLLTLVPRVLHTASNKTSADTGDIFHDPNKSPSTHKPQVSVNVAQQHGDFTPSPVFTSHH